VRHFVDLAVTEELSDRIVKKNSWVIERRGGRIEARGYVVSRLDPPRSNCRRGHCPSLPKIGIRRPNGTKWNDKVWRTGARAWPTVDKTTAECFRQCYYSWFIASELGGCGDPPPRRGWYLPKPGGRWNELSGLKLPLPWLLDHRLNRSCLSSCCDRTNNLFVTPIIIYNLNSPCVW